MARHQFAVIALAAIALLSSSWLLLDILGAASHTRVYGVAAFESRFDGFRKTIQPHSVYGYVSDNPPTDPSARAEFYLTQYTLTPAIVKNNPDERLVIVNYHSQKPDEKLLADNKLALIQNFGNGVLLCREKAAMMFACLAAIWLTGFGLVRGVFPAPLRWSLHNVLLFSLGIGAGAGVASCLWFLSLVLAGPNFAVMASVIGGMTIAALAFGLLTRRPGTPLQWAEDPDPPWYLRAAFLLAIALAVTTFLVAVSNNPHGDEGAWSIWNLRARFLLRAGVFWRGAFSPDLSWSHPDYPLLLPGLVALCWKLSGEESTAAPIAIAFLFALGTAALLTGVLGVLRGKTHAMLGGTLLLGTAGFLSLAAAQYGDVPLSFYILAALALLCLQDRYPEDLRFSVLAGLMAGFAAWTRNEGVIFLIAVVAARLAVAFRFRDRTPSSGLRKQMLWLAAGALAPLAVTIFFKLRVGGASEFLSEAPGLVLQHLADPGRWILTIQTSVIGLFGLGRFVVSIMLVLALYWYLVRFRVEERDRAPLAFLGTALALTLAIELLVDIAFVNTLNLELGTSLERALLHLWPAGVMLFFLASGPLQLSAASQPAKGKAAKNAPRSSRRVAETR